MVLKLPANTAPRNTRTKSTAAASLGPMAKTINTVTMLESPILIPGMGVRGGIWASTMKMVSAMAVSMERVVSLTEESFAALASEKTEDPGSQATGGLYQQVYEGQMVPEFNDWCFDASRQYGDYGLVKTDYGYHVMFFVNSQPQWTTYAASDWANEQSAKLLEEIVAEYPMEVAYENIALGVVALG